MLLGLINVAFGCMSQSAFCCLGLCHIHYSVVWDCVICVNIARVYVVRNYFVRYTVGVSNEYVSINIYSITMLNKKYQIKILHTNTL